LLLGHPSGAQTGVPEPILNAQAWRYSRVYPLLDGLFQDAASTQLKSLALDPNSANATSLDALQQSIQFQIQYSQLAGIQNAAAAQTIVTNTGYQTQLVQQQANLLQAQLLSQKQLGDAQNKLDSLPSNADSSTAAAAKQAVTIAQDNLNSIGAEVALVKAQMAAPAYTPSPASGSLTSQLPTPQQIPSSLTSSATTAAPSFPATKQMDNQMELLWERLSRVVGTMTRPDSLNANASLYLVEFDTGIFPERGKRKHELLDTTYTLGCAGTSERPTVVDMFPRAAAVNITNIKYRDTSFGIGALLSFFGIGISGGYNREHLRLSQLLGQSSYITGHGIGQSEFGWLFGIAVGDDQISSDTRKTFALLEVPSACTQPAVKLESATWSNKSSANAALNLNLPGGSAGDSIGIKSMSYNRIEFDPAAASSTSPVNVTVRIELDQDMDQQATVSVNGIPLKRARDTFGRAIGTGGSGGLLEVGALGTNIWIPSGSRTLLITLDASTFGDRFPMILLSSPDYAIDVGARISDQTDLVISGRHLRCSGNPCERSLPSLGFVKSSARRFVVARWMKKSRGEDKIAITLADPSVIQNTPAGASSPAVPSVQVLSISDAQSWGPTVSVQAVNAKGESVQLKCDQAEIASRLLCDAPAYDSTSDSYLPVTLEIVDTAHTGGPIKGAVHLNGCNNNAAAASPCRQPLIWDMRKPMWDVSDGLNPKWLFDVLLVNVEDNRKVYFTKNGGELRTAVRCPQDDQPCVAHFHIPESRFVLVSDSMPLQIEGPAGKFYVATITNLRSNIRPIATQIDADKASWYGQNFVFDKMKVGDTGSVYTILCSQDASTCHVKGKYSSKDTGFLYFVNEGELIEFIQLNSSGSLVPVFLEAEKKPASPGKGQGSQEKSTKLALRAPNAPGPLPGAELQRALPMQAVQ